MANKKESIATDLGALRTGLVEEGFTADQAFWIIQDLIRCDHIPARTTPVK